MNRTGWFRIVFDVLLFLLVFVEIFSGRVHAIASSSSNNNNMSSTGTIQKTIREICRKPPKHWVGDGFHVYPVFANKAFTSELSPFLMFDYAAPKHFPPEKNPSSSRSNHRRGVGQHPHRGFETVTIAFEGEVEHADSAGNSGIIGPGDVQWMTAGKGIIHEEFHSTEFSKKGGIFEMCQLWVNLPSRQKMTKPRYQPILAKDIPQVPLLSVHHDAADEEDDDVCSLDEGYAKVIAGDFRGTKGPARTHTPVNLWIVTLLTKNKEFELEFVEGHNTIVFVRNGGVQIQGRELNIADVAILEREGTKLVVKATQKNTSLLVLSGEPIDEPIAARGPFVMNTQRELQQAMMDYQEGKHGFKHFNE